MLKKSIIAIILSIAMLMSASVILVYAADTTYVPVDVGSLFDPNYKEPVDPDDEDEEDTVIPDENDDKKDNDSDDDNEIPTDKETNESTAGSTEGESTTGKGPAITPSQGETKDETKEETNKEPEKPTEPEVVEPVTPVVKVTFTDVKEEDWFYNDVGTLAGMGIINGYLDNTFRPDDGVTRAEFLKLLIVLLIGENNTFVTYDRLFEDVDVNEWYAKYITTAFVFGIIDRNDYGTTFEPDKPITRREVAKFVMKALQVESGGFKSPYVDTSDHDVTSLYGLGLMQGTVDPTTGYRYFYPETDISRAEASAVILRLYKLSVDGQKYVDDFMKANNLPPLQSLYVPTTKNDFYNELSNAWDNNQAFVVYNYDFGSGSEQMRVVNENLNDAYNLCSTHHPELATHVSLKTTTESDGQKTKMTVEFVPSIDGITYQGLVEKKELAEKKAYEIVSSLFSGDETDIEKANIIHDYIADTLEYDYSYSNTSYTAYGALFEKKAVCQGYSSLFNIMCKAAGVSALAVASDNHMWNVVLADNKIYHYDVTESDTNNSSVKKSKGVEETAFFRDDGHTGYSLPDVIYFS